MEINSFGCHIRDGQGAPVSVYLGYQLEMLVHEGEAFRLLEAVRQVQQIGLHNITFQSDLQILVFVSNILDMLV